MIEKDIMWHTYHHQKDITELMLLQQQLYNQRIEINTYYNKNNLNDKNDKNQEKHDDWKNMGDTERYHIMRETEILEKLNKKNPAKTQA